MSAPTAMYSKASDNVCMWKQQSSDACDTPRSCYDCLNTRLGSGVDCVITSAGLCSTLTDYVWQQDYRLHRSDNTSSFFPSTNTTYCEANDSVCATCRARQSTDPAFVADHPSQFCVGASGCVCLAYCDSPGYSSAVAFTHCATLDTAGRNNGSSPFCAIIVITLAFIVPAMVYYWYARRLRKHRLAYEDLNRSRQSVDALTLSRGGWKKRQDDLGASDTTIISDDGSVVSVSSEAGGQQTGRAASNAPPSAPLTSIEPDKSCDHTTLATKLLISSNNASANNRRPSLPMMTSSEEDSATGNDMDENRFAQL